jgi:protein gp37
MADGTKIAWTDASWNPITGCSPVSPGCANCYAARMARRFAGPGGRYEGQVTDGRFNGYIRHVLGAGLIPHGWKKPRRVFVCSMGDIFHDNVTDEWIVNVWRTMRECERHTFQVLTKRPDRYFALQSRLVDLDHPPANIWLGVSAEDQTRGDARIPVLLQCAAAVRWVSLEPLIGDIDLFAFLDTPIRNRSLLALGGSPMPGLDWVVVGCETGPRRRLCKLEWARSVVDQCRDTGTPCFVKQLELVNDGNVSKNPDEWPNWVRVRQYPGDV